MVASLVTREDAITPLYFHYCYEMLAGPVYIVDDAP
jgi:hypothetical protein